MSKTEASKSNPKQALTTSPFESALNRTVSAAPPEAFPLPQLGQDPHFGLSRSSYYNLERAGLIRLIRVRLPGNIRGRVLVPYQAARDALARFAATSEPIAGPIAPKSNKRGGDHE